MPSLIRTKDNTVGGGFSEIAGEEFVCDQSSSGHDHASDNVCAGVFDSLGEAKSLTSDISYSGEMCVEGDVD